jgi:predicted ABC-type ATPase
MLKPILWIIAGPNGAGKTTFVREGTFAKALSSCEFINPDAWTQELLIKEGVMTWGEAEERPELLKKTFIQAAEAAQRHLEKKIEQGGNVGIESVLSSSKYCQVVERVRQLGGSFYLVYVALHSPHLSRSRVEQRSGEGGHSVPWDKLEPRWRKSLQLLPWFASKASRFWVLDNSDSAEGGQPRILFTGAESTITLHGIPVSPMRPVASEILTQHAKNSEAGKWRIELKDTQAFSR